MAETTKQRTRELFGKIASYSALIQQNYVGKYFDKFSPYAKEYESTLDLILDILKVCGHDERRLTIEILNIVLGESSIGSVLESGYHGAIDSIESKLAIIESKQDNDSFIYKLEDAVKVTISSILTSFLSCSVSPFIPKESLDTYCKKHGVLASRPVVIPTHILDFSNTLHVSPVSETGIYFYNTDTNTTYFKRTSGYTEATTATIADIRERNAETYTIYEYDRLESLEGLTDEQKKKFKKMVSVPASVKVRQDEKPPEEFVYTVRPKVTAESLYKTDDMNAFIWYVANRGDNTEDIPGNVNPNVIYEYNKLAWDSRRLNSRVMDTKRSTPEDWNNWLLSRTDYGGILKLVKDNKEVEDLYPILQIEPSELWGNLEHLVVTFPAQRYLTTKTILGQEYEITKTIYKFNSDYLKSIKIFNWKTILMNLLYELNGISPVPDVRFNISLSDEIIDARLSTLILDTIVADDKEVDDSYYSFTNEDYSEALKMAEIRKYGAKPYDTASSTAIQNPSGTPLDVIDSVSTAATLNELKSTITRGVYSVAGTSGSTGITKTTLSANLEAESNFLHNLLFAIVKPFVRAILSPQIMLLFCINLDVMGLVNMKDLSKRDMDAVSDFIFRKLASIIKKLIIQIKDEIAYFLLVIVREEIKKLIDEIGILLLLEQLNDYIRLLNQIMECIRRFGIGTTVHGIDEVNYADIIPEAKGPKRNE